MDASHMGDHLSNVLITEEQIRARLDELAGEIVAEYAGKDLLLVGILKGAVQVMADLQRALPISVPVDWMAVSSYGSGTKSSGVVRILKDLDVDITGKHVLIVEDILDSGNTLDYLMRNFRTRGPKSVRTAVLLDKPDRHILPIDIAYLGFTIPDVWVVGYGLDYNEKYRTLPYIAEMKPQG